MCSFLQSINRSAEECGSGEIYQSRTLKTQVRQSAEVGVIVAPPHLFPPFRGGEVRVGRLNHFIAVEKLVPMPLFASEGLTAAQQMCSLSQKKPGVAHG